MKTFKGRIVKKMKFLIALIIATPVIVLFQNCGPNAFRTQNFEKLQGSEQLSSGSTDNHFPEENLPETVDDPQNEIVPDPSKVSTTSSTGKVYFVSTSGNNNNPGTVSKPFKSIAYAVSKMVAGDTTYVKGGVYSDHVEFARSGTASAPIKLLNVPGEKPVINCGNVGTKMVLIKNGAGILKPMGYITIEGFEIRNCWHGIAMYNGYNIIIRGNKIHDNLKQGILGNGKNTLVDSNVISHNGDFAKCAANKKSCNQMHGIYGTGPNWVVTNNLIYGNLAFGVHVAGYSHCPKEAKCTYIGHPLINYFTDATWAGADNWLIANNTIAYNNYGSAIILWRSRTTNSKIINNILYENGQKAVGENGIAFLGSGGGHVIKNNLCYATAPGGTVCIGDGQGKYTQSDNIVNTLNPKFVNAPASLPSAPNFMLTASSPAINKGLSTTATKIDFRGVARPQGGVYDLGAYEFTGSSSP